VSGPHYRRFVVLGDSSAEGLGDPDGCGSYRGWADRLADHVARSSDGLRYANLGIRGRRARDVREEQLPAALAMQPDLAGLIAGTNDAVSRRFDAAAVADDVEVVQRALIGAGATVVTFTMPEVDRVLPLVRSVSARIRELNRHLRTVAAATGAVLVDFEQHPFAGDPRVWSEDRFHANALGHARIAAALAHALGLPGADASWSEPLPEPLPAGPSRRLAGDVRWALSHLVPWLWRHGRGRSSGDGRGPRRPRLEPWPTE